MRDQDNMRGVRGPSPQSETHHDSGSGGNVYPSMDKFMKPNNASIPPKKSNPFSFDSTSDDDTQQNQATQNAKPEMSAFRDQPRRNTFSEHSPQDMSDHHSMKSNGEDHRPPPVKFEITDEVNEGPAF